MENEDEQVQEEVVEQEEQQETEETTTEAEVEETKTEEEDETVTLKKSDFTKLNRKARAYDATKSEVKPIEKSDITTKSAKGNFSMEKLERIELRQDGYSKDEVDEIMELGGAKVLGSKLVQSAIKAMRAEKKSKDATPEFSAKSPVYKKHTQEDLNGMSSAELEKILPHA